LRPEFSRNWGIFYNFPENDRVRPAFLPGSGHGRSRPQFSTWHRAPDCQGLGAAESSGEGIPLGVERWRPGMRALCCTGCARWRVQRCGSAARACGSRRRAGQQEKSRLADAAAVGGERCFSPAAPSCTPWRRPIVVFPVAASCLAVSCRVLPCLAVSCRAVAL
jgi:hypothetical protein